MRDNTSRGERMLKKCRARRRQWATNPYDLPCLTARFKKKPSTRAVSAIPIARSFTIAATISIFRLPVSKCFEHF